MVNARTSRNVTGCTTRVVRAGPTLPVESAYCGRKLARGTNQCIFHLLLDSEHDARLRARGRDKVRADRRTKTRTIQMNDPYRYDALMLNLCDAAQEIMKPGYLPGE